MKIKNIAFSRIMKKYLILLFIILLMENSWAEGDSKTNPAARKGNSLHHVYIPPGFSLQAPKKAHYADNGIEIDLYAREFALGNAVYAEVFTGQKDKNFTLLKITYDGSPVPFTKTDWGFRGFFGISPEALPGEKTLIIQYSLEGLVIDKIYTLAVKKSQFPVYTTPLDLGKFSDTRRRTAEEIKFINDSQEKKNRAFTLKSPDLMEDLLSHPRDIHYITSPFWSKRVYMNYRVKNGEKVLQKSSSNIHKGIDLKGETGTPVFSIASGTVALAEELYYEGYMIIISHGNGIYSYFMHMSGVKVKPGDVVRAGDIIGLVGSTGVSTAAHLHVSFIIRGVQVDPLSMLQLPIRDITAESSVSKLK